jgi:hypothetical protein
MYSLHNNSFYAFTWYPVGSWKGTCVFLSTRPRLSPCMLRLTTASWSYVLGDLSRSKSVLLPVGIQASSSPCVCYHPLNVLAWPLSQRIFYLIYKKFFCRNFLWREVWFLTDVNCVERQKAWGIFTNKFLLGLCKWGQRTVTEPDSGSWSVDTDWVCDGS